MKAPCIAPAQDITEMEDESSTALLDQIVHEAETTRSGGTGEKTRQAWKQLEICSMEF